MTCPADSLAASGTVCRPKAGDCDIAESCDGASAACPADTFVAQGTLCRASVGGCDSAESCSGTAGTCPADNTSCQSGFYCSGATCISKRSNGQACSSHAQCHSGNCYDGYCCNKRCGGVCRNCGLAGQQGTCVTYAHDTDPENECGAYQCYHTPSAPICPTNCDRDSECKSTHFCYRIGITSGKCVPKLQDGDTCHDDNRCASGHCWRWPGVNNAGRCCSTACDGCCGDCSTGTCQNKPIYSQPNISTCGRYTCDGQGGRFTSCVKDAFNCSAHCGSAYWCWAGKCEKDLPGGAACLGSCQCKSDFCWFWSCR